MNFVNLEENIIDIIQEQQLKLGYRKEIIRLYYPLLSLNRLLCTNCDISQMQAALKSFCSFTQERLGQIEITHQKDRFCLIIPARGSEYVHENTENDSFLRDFIDTISRHNVTMEEVLQQFHKHSEHVHVKQPENAEFDYLVYFEDGIPDSYRYCITHEGCHIVYHRFTIEDYNDLQSETKLP